jgi:hypothetical protein
MMGVDCVRAGFWEQGGGLRDSGDMVGLVLRDGWGCRRTTVEVVWGWHPRRGRTGPPVGRECGEGCASE